MENKNIRYIKGVGEKRAALFNKKGINTLEDLLYFFPRSHEDRSKTRILQTAYTEKQSVFVVRFMLRCVNTEFATI